MTEDQRGVTKRAVLFALLISALTMPAAFLTEIVWGKGQWGTGAPAPWPVTVVVILTLVMGFPFLRRRGLTRQELLVIYSIVLVTAPLMSRTLLFYAVPKAIIYYYAARQNPLWEATFIKYIPWWFAPNDYASIEGFFLGGSVPWAKWAIPLAAWYSLMLAVFGASFSLIVLLQRQWVTNERLAFPLAQIPLETIREGEAGVRGKLTNARLFWLGAGIAFALSILATLGTVYPAIPYLPLTPIMVTQWQGTGPLAGLGSFYLNFSPALLGIIYIIPKELSFSCWFFWVLRLVVHVIAISVGIQPQKPESWSNDFPAPYETGAGATIAFGIWALWLARKHLVRAIRLTFARKEEKMVDDPVIYRWALLGFVICFSWTLACCWFVGCRLSFALALMTVIVGTFLVWSRVRADTALEPCVAEGTGWITAAVGSKGLRPQEILTMISMKWATFPVGSMIFSAPVMNSLDAFKIADSASINQRRFTLALFISFALMLGLGMVVMLLGIYHNGYFDTKSGSAPYWPSLYNRLDGGVITSMINTPSNTDTKTLWAMLGGGVFCTLLGLLRLRFWWWPLHPVGFIVAMGWGLIDTLVPFFFGWAAKSLVIRYGGLHAYRKTVPLAIGLIVGGLFSTSFWSLAALVTGGAAGPPNY